MKRIQCKLRTAEAVQDWLRFVASVEHLASSSKFRVNGKQRNGTGFYSALQCDVASEHIVDFLTEYIVFIEQRPTLSFEISVQEGEEPRIDKPIGESSTEAFQDGEKSSNGPLGNHRLRGSL